MEPLGKHAVEVTASVLTAVVVVAAVIFLPFPRSERRSPPPAGAIDERTDYSLDTASVGATTIVLRWHPQSAIAFSRDGEIVFGGWAVDSALERPASSVLAVVDGGAVFPARLGIERPDVAAKFRQPAFAASGFRLAIPRCSLAAGSHRVAFRFEAADGRGYFRSRDDVDIDVRAAGTHPCGPKPLAS